MSFILEFLLDLLIPDGGGSRKRDRQRREMWERHEFPALRRNERLSTWFGGVGRAESGRLHFDAPPVSSDIVDIRTAELAGPGPAMLGQTKILKITTGAGRTEVFAVLKEYSADIASVICPQNTSPPS